MHIFAMLLIAPIIRSLARLRWCYESHPYLCGNAVLSNASSGLWCEGECQLLSVNCIIVKSDVYFYGIFLAIYFWLQRLILLFRLSLTLSTSRLFHSGSSKAIYVSCNFGAFFCLFFAFSISNSIKSVPIIVSTIQFTVLIYCFLVIQPFKVNFSVSWTLQWHLKLCIKYATVSLKS